MPFGSGLKRLTDSQVVQRHLWALVIDKLANKSGLARLTRAPHERHAGFLSSEVQT